MALVEATMTASVKAELDTAYGATAGPEAEAERDKISGAIAKAILDILTTQMVVTIPAGITSNGGTFVSSVGTIS